MSNKPVIDLVGKRFGRLVVLRRSEKRGPKNQIRWHCICDCGRETEPYGYSLRYGQTTTCGCGRIGSYTAFNGRKPLTTERLREVLEYEPTTGVFRWKLKITRTALAGARAGAIDVHGHRVIAIDGRLYRAGRLAWMYVHGAMPSRFIDHKNGIRDDDRIENLREATDSENARNSRGHAASGLKGAYFDKQSGAWFSNIRLNGKQHHLGVFASKEEAHAAWAAAAEEQYGEFATSRHRQRS